jgi:hypothetical protein
MIGVEERFEACLSIETHVFGGEVLALNLVLRCPTAESLIMKKKC